MNTIKTLAILIVAGLAIYIWRVPLYTVAMQSSAVLLPCKQTITYRLGNIDPGFRLSTSTALSAMNEAAQLWNDGQSRSLLVYDPDDGAVVISFEYDK